MSSSPWKDIGISQPVPETWQNCTPEQQEELREWGYGRLSYLTMRQAYAGFISAAAEDKRGVSYDFITYCRRCTDPHRGWHGSDHYEQDLIDAHNLSRLQDIEAKAQALMRLHPGIVKGTVQPRVWENRIQLLKAALEAESLETE